LKGYQQLAEIAPGLRQLAKEYPQSGYFRKIVQQVDVVLTKNRTLADNLQQAHRWLRQIAVCLRYPPSQYPDDHPTSQQVAQEIETLLEQFDAHHPISRPQAVLLGKFNRLWHSYGSQLLPCYDLPGLPPDNLELENLFGRLRSHQRRISGRRSTAPLREFGHYQVLFCAHSQAELLDQLRSAPLSQYQVHRNKLRKAESTRRFFHRLHRDPAKTILQLVEQYYVRSSQLYGNHTPDDNV
jgi:hypothetical protein